MNRELTAEEKLALTGFKKAVRFAGGPVTPSDAYLVLVMNSDQILPLEGPREMWKYADSLREKGYLKEIGHDRYELKDVAIEDAFKPQTPQQA